MFNRTIGVYHRLLCVIDHPKVTYRRDKREKIIPYLLMEGKKEKLNEIGAQIAQIEAV